MLKVCVRFSPASEMRLLTYFVSLREQMTLRGLSRIAVRSDSSEVEISSKSKPAWLKLILSGYTSVRRQEIVRCYL